MYEIKGNYQPFLIKIEGEEVPVAALWACTDCGSVVFNRAAHDNFHENMSRTASDASWGRLNRPIG